MVPAVPSFADFKFKTIGKPPGLLSRLSDPSGHEATQDEVERTPSPTPTATPDPALQYPSRGITPRNSFTRPTLLQALSAEGISQESLKRVKEEAIASPSLRSPSSGNPFEVRVSFFAPLNSFGATGLERKQADSDQMRTSQSSPSTSRAGLPEEQMNGNGASVPHPSQASSNPFQLTRTTSAMDQAIAETSHGSDASTSPMQAHLHNAHDLQAKIDTALSSLHVHDLSKPLLAIQQSAIHAETALKQARESKFKLERCQELLDEVARVSQSALLAAETANSHAAEATRAIKELSDAAGSEPWRQLSTISAAQDHLRSFSHLIEEMEKADLIKTQELLKGEEEIRKLQAELAVARPQPGETLNQPRPSSSTVMGAPVRSTPPSTMNLEQRSLRPETPSISTIPPSNSNTLARSTSAHRQIAAHTPNNLVADMADLPSMSTSNDISGFASGVLSLDGLPGVQNSSFTTQPGLPSQPFFSKESFDVVMSGNNSLEDQPRKASSTPSRGIAELSSPRKDPSPNNRNASEEVSVVSHLQDDQNDQKLQEEASDLPSNDVAILPPSPSPTGQRSTMIGLKPYPLPPQRSNQNGMRPSLVTRPSQTPMLNRFQSVPPIATFTEAPSSPEDSPKYEHSRTQESGNVPIIPDPTPASPPAKANLRHIRERQNKSPRKTPATQRQSAPSLVPLLKKEVVSPKLTAAIIMDREMPSADARVQPSNRTDPTPSAHDQQAIQSTPPPVSNPTGTPSLPSRKRLLSTHPTTPIPSSATPAQPSMEITIVPEAPGSQSRPSPSIKQGNAPPSISKATPTASPVNPSGPAQGAAKSATSTASANPKIPDRRDVFSSNASDHSPPPTISLSASPDPSPHNSVTPPIAPVIPQNPASIGVDRRVADNRARTQVPGRPISPTHMRPQSQTLGKRKQPFDDGQDGNRVRPRMTQGQGAPPRMLPPPPPPGRPSTQPYRPSSPMDRSRTPPPLSSGGALGLRIGGHYDPGVDSDRYGGQNSRSHYGSEPHSPSNQQRPKIIYERPVFPAPPNTQPMGPPTNHPGRGRGVPRARGTHQPNYRGRGGGQPHAVGGQHQYVGRSSLQDRLSSPTRPAQAQSPSMSLADRISSNSSQQQKFF